jgi:hypothetical protein
MKGVNGGEKMIEELKRMSELVGELPEAEQQTLCRAFLATIDAYFQGQQLAMRQEFARAIGNYAPVERERSKVSVPGPQRVKQ